MDGFAGRVRPADGADFPFLREMLYEAVRPDPGEEDPGIDWVLSDPRNAVYIEGWGRQGDVAVVAEDPEGAPAGAAWFRSYPAQARGYGFVDEATPEVTMAVVEGSRGRGVGTALLDGLIESARDLGVASLSLSVFPGDPAAVRLYTRHGFEQVGTFEDLWVMRLDLAGERSC